MTPITKGWLHRNGYRCAGEPAVWFDKHGDRIGFDDRMVSHLVEVLLRAESARLVRQGAVAAWCVECFGDEHANSLPQRGIRLAEEAIELAQAAGSPADKLHALIDYVYARPAGTVFQELGGVGVTALALAAAAAVSADEAEATEVLRVLSKPREHFTARNEAKNAAGFNVVP